MRDAELLAHAQYAAVRLEKAWERWRARHDVSDHRADPVVSYVGYSMTEPMGRPRVVVGVDAADAELLADFLERHDPDVAGSPSPPAAVDEQPAVRGGPPGDPPRAEAQATIGAATSTDRPADAEPPAARDHPPTDQQPTDPGRAGAPVPIAVPVGFATGRQAPHPASPDGGGQRTATDPVATELAG